MGILRLPAVRHVASIAAGAAWWVAVALRQAFGRAAAAISSVGLALVACAVALLIATVFGLATVIVRANAGPPGYLRWQGLPQNLKDGKITGGGVNIEVVPGDDSTITLIVPLKKLQNPGEE